MTNENDLEIVKQALHKLLSFMDIHAEVEHQIQEGMVVFNLKTDDSGILIGPRGSHLSALQYLTRIVVHKKLSEEMHFVLDVEGYKKSREDFLRELARQAAARVRDTKETLLLKPMSSYERRVIHAEISGLPDVSSESLGEEPERRVVIKPKE